MCFYFRHYIKLAAVGFKYLILFVILEILITPDQFAELLCEDLELPMVQFIPAIAQSIRQQVDSFPTDNLLSNQTDQRVVIKVSFEKALFVYQH